MHDPYHLQLSWKNNVFVHRFDELHYGRFTAMYLQRRFFFDQHPPLGKLLLTLGACLCGFDGEYKFERIGAGDLLCLVI